MIELDVLCRFWSYVDRRSVNECWKWCGCKVKTGNNYYGQLRVNRKMILVHRISYEIHFGMDPGPLFVCHTCDFGLCVNSNHLFLGTNQDNQLDNVAKGRHRNPVGELTNLAILTWIEAREIRRLYKSGLYSQKTLAIRFGVDQATISRIITNKTWIE